MEEERATACDVRGKFVEELWGLAREFRIREQEQAKADQLGKKLARLEGVETDLREAERCRTTHTASEMWYTQRVIVGKRYTRESVRRKR